MNGVSLLQLRQDGSGSNKRQHSGFLLTDTLIAAVLSMMFFIPSLLLVNGALRVYEKAQEMQNAAMYGRLCMEEGRYSSPGSTIEKQFEEMGKTYEVVGRCEQINDLYSRYEIKVTTPGGDEYLFKRLERKRSQP